MELVWGRGRSVAVTGDIVYTHGAAGGHCSKWQVPTFPVLPPCLGPQGALSLFSVNHSFHSDRTLVLRLISSCLMIRILEWSE